MGNIVKKLGLVSLLAFTGVAFAEKVVVVPLLGDEAKFEPVAHHYSIPGRTFTPVRTYTQTEAAGWIVSHVRPGIVLVGYPTQGVTHRKDGATMAFTAPVHLPDGAALWHVGASVCSVETTGHNIIVSLQATNKETGEVTTIRSRTITATNCDTLQSGAGFVVFHAVDNTQYAYELYITGIEGGVCTNPSPLFWSCDNRKTYLELGNVQYTTQDIIKP